MILMVIAPDGERWAIDPAPPAGHGWAQWLRTLPINHGRAAEALLKLYAAGPPPRGRAHLAHMPSGWQAIISDPL